MAYLKLFLLFLSIFIFSLSYLFLLLFLCPFPYLGRYLRSFVLKNWSKFSLLILGVRVVRKGHFPDKSFLLISNHLSYIDIIVYYSLVDCSFLAKLEIASWPLIGKIISLFGTIYIDRRKKTDILRVIPLIVENLQSGNKICFFPEGTSSDGKQIKKFYSALFACAVRSQSPVIVSSLTYYSAAQDKGLSVHESVCWWGEGLNFIEHCLELAKVPKVIAYVNVAPEEFYGASYENNPKLLSQICRKKMLEIFRPSEDLEDLSLWQKKIKV